MGTGRPAAAEPSEIAGRYQVVKKLGAGAFGTVYKAKDKILGRMVAIKTIRLEGLAAAGSSLDELMDRFKREAMVSAQLKHPHIVTIYDIGDSDGMSYLAMEFIDGVGLDRVIATGGKLPIERAALLGSQVADALDFAHKGNVVHRDIKPANIMVEGGDRVKVTDFGIAKVTDSGDHLTVTGSLLGTPSYMSPEQARGAALDGRSDLFSAGCVLYEMVAGRKAFRGDSITGLIFKIITEEPPSLKEMDPDIPEEMVRIIAKALSKAPEGRYQTGRDLSDDLLRLTRAGATPTLRQTEVSTANGITPVSGFPVVTGAAAPAPALPTMVLPGTVSAPATVKGAAATRVMPPPPPSASMPVASAPPARGIPARPAPSPPAPRSGGSTGLIVGLVGGGLVLLLALGAGAWFVLKPKDTKTADVGTGGGVSGTGSTGPLTSAPPATAPPVVTAPPDTAPPATLGGGVAPPATVPVTPGTQPGNQLPPATRPAGREVAPPTQGGPRTAPPATEPVSPGFTFLDEEPPPMDGREAGGRLADTYRTDRGTNTGGNFGASGRFRARDRSPRNLAVPERPAVATLRHIMDREEAFHRKQNRYGSFAELASATGFALDVPVAASGFQRKGYRFELKVEPDGFEVTALPAVPGLRSFMGDDSGIIRPMGE